MVSGYFINENGNMIIIRSLAKIWMYW